MNKYIDKKKLILKKKISNFIEYFSKHLSVILEDERRFSAYFKKRFPKSFKYLPKIKFVTFLVMLITLRMDYNTYYSIISSSRIEEEFYSKYIFFFYFMIIVYEYVLSIYVTFKANSPVSNTPVIRRSPIRRSKSEPISRKFERPAIKRHKTS